MSDGDRVVGSVSGRKLTAQQAVKLFQKFWDSCGAEECGLAFGWDRPQQQLRRSETAYAFSSGDPLATVGFGTLEIDVNYADDNEAAFTCGVFPEHRRCGHWRAIVQWLTRRARRLGADSISQIIFLGNEKHHARVLHESEAGPWIYAGKVWYPNPYSYFVLPLDGSGSEEALFAARAMARRDGV